MRWIEFAQEPAAKGGLAAAYFADQHDKTLLLLHPEFQVGQGLLVSGTQIEEFRVGSDVEGHLLEPIEILIHVALRASVTGAKGKRPAPAPGIVNSYLANGARRARGYWLLGDSAPRWG